MSDKLRAVGILQKQLMGAHYARALDAKRDRRPIVYVTAMFPVEIVEAFEPHIATVYPENHAAMLSANGKEDLAQEAIAAGLGGSLRMLGLPGEIRERLCSGVEQGHQP